MGRQGEETLVGERVGGSEPHPGGPTALPCREVELQRWKSHVAGVRGTAQNPTLPLSSSVIMDKLFNPSEPHFVHANSHNSFSSLTVVRIKWNKAHRLLSAVLAHSKYPIKFAIISMIVIRLTD